MSYSVSEICYESGFNHLSQFQHDFLSKKHSFPLRRFAVKVQLVFFNSQFQYATGAVAFFHKVPLPWFFLITEA